MVSASIHGPTKLGLVMADHRLLTLHPSRVVVGFLDAFLIGAGVSLSLGIPPGPVLAKMAHETSRGHSVTGLLIGLGAMMGDGVYFVAAYAGVLATTPPDAVLGAMAFVGVVLMSVLSVGAWLSAKRPAEAHGRTRNGLATGFALAVTSPFNIAWWATSGVPFVARYGAALAFGFFIALGAWVVVCVLLFRYGSLRLPRFYMYVAYAGSSLLAVFAFILAYQGLAFIDGSG
jgi:threonine/homoserine/homoserine lactone efflux protein